MKLKAKKKKKKKNLQSSKVQVHVMLIPNFFPSLWNRQWKTALIPINKSKHDFNSRDYICAYSLKY